MKRSLGFAPLAFMLFMPFMVQSSALAQQKPPVFRAGVDLRQLDVTVLDNDRRPVRGLTAADFVVTEDDVEQKIEAFTFVDLADRVVTRPPAWAARARSDVVTNELGSARVFVLVIDDVDNAGGIGDLWARKQLPKSLTTFVERLEPDDIGALVFPGHGEESVNFTRDKAKLIHAVDGYLTRLDTAVGAKDACNPPRRVPEAMLYVAENLAALKNRRKAIVYFGANLNFKGGIDRCGVGELWTQAVRVANENNIAVYPVDTMGLLPGRPPDRYISLANETGGHAIVNTNSFTEGLLQIYEENASYYLLAYQPANLAEDGRFRHVSVTVKKPGLEVVRQRDYWAPKAPTGRAAPRPAPPAELEALAGVLPVAQIPMRASAAPFRLEEETAAAVAVSLGLTVPAFAERTRESVDVLTRIFTPDGIDYGSDRQLVTVTVPAAPAGADVSRYEVLAHVIVPKPGRYELRFSAHSESTDSRGSIYVDVDVPDFRKAPLSLSGVVMNSALSTAPVAPPNLLRDVVPIVPTTERTFAPSDIVTAFLRVYQGGGAKLVPVRVTVTITDASGAAAFTKTDAIIADAFGAERSADYRFHVPLTTLKAGQYLLSFDAAAGKTAARRDVQFRVK